MKNLVYLLTLLSIGAFAQEKQKDVVTVSANYNFSEPTQYGVSLEFTKDTDPDNRLTSRMFNVSYGQLEYNNENLKSTGQGFVIELGSRTYFKKSLREGFYGENFITHGQIKFNEQINGENFEGKYTFWSIFNPNIGYKIQLSKNLSLDPSVGFNWKWEVKGKGGIDNRNFDNFVFKYGVKLGYSF
ncbi:hypothetical protein P3875_02355 [Myroides sp. JBRI-B21084]|uniref:hypothetical protein n=1 Tax=Myroides sp. JBRI-B21084 TaxID=3119977 RepID=UPI0026E1CBE9|nr:hypothetical protein [Paenimyroides cloacae]WKW46917.1 hypothetical protein P3875_02355 [Paenimyroides cloacae]